MVPVHTSGLLAGIGYIECRCCGGWSSKKDEVGMVIVNWSRVVYIGTPLSAVVGCSKEGSGGGQAGRYMTGTFIL